MATRTEHAGRPNRESLSKRLGKLARQIKARDGHRCVYCGADEASERRAGRHMHLDHLVPHVEGGTDTADNLCLSCHRCNSVRHDMPLATWARYAAAHLTITFTARSVRAQARRALPAV
jgi:5-methylcytosine-specific restriction endonuclease McrA